MTEKLNNILFHPSTLIKFKNTHFLKVLLYLFLLSIFSMIIPIIDTVQDPTFSLADKPYVEAFFNFDVAKNLPDCSLQNNEFSCLDEASSQQVIGTAFGVVNIVTDVNDTMKVTNNEYYLKFTENQIKFENKNMTYYSISYKNLPSNWQSFNFNTIKTAIDPSNALYLLFISGFNQIIIHLVPLILTITIFTTFIFKVFEILIYSLIFYLLFRRLQYKFKEIFKITVFAETLAVTMGLILELLGLGSLSSYVAIALIFIYMNVAMAATSNPPNEVF